MTVLIALGMSKSKPLPRHTDPKRQAESPLYLRGIRKIDTLGYWMLVVCLVCMALTVLTTWLLWQNRTTPPNLPLFDGLTGLSFGFLILIGLAATAVWPRQGLIGLVVLLLASIGFDLIRCQPQVFAIPVLMAACVWRPMRPVACWFLVAMWLWAGIHKIVSPYWMGSAAWSLLNRLHLSNANELYLGFAWVVALSEVALAVVAILKPKWAAAGCIALHCGIVGMLLAINWNFSVLYWNIATAVVGAWLMWTWRSLPAESVKSNADSKADSGAVLTTANDSGRPALVLWQKVVVSVLLISPIGVYNGWVPHFLAHVLYSEHMPRAMMTTSEGPVEISTWDSLNVPVPRTRSILPKYFRAVASPGDKLHILDSRPLLEDMYFQASPSGNKILAVDRETFYSGRAVSGGLQGIGKDFDPAVFALQLAGVKMLKKTKQGMIYAVAFTPENYDAELLKHVRQLPNLEEIQLARCSVADDDLRHLDGLLLLNGIGLSGTQVTDDCLVHLKDLPSLHYIESDGTSLTFGALEKVLK